MLESGRWTPERLTLLDLVEPKRWQRLQDHFAGVVGIPIRTVDAQHALQVNPSWPTHLHVEPTIELLNVGEELDQLLPIETPPVATASLTTPLGVTYAAVPIHVTSDDVLAYFVLGPMIVGRREEEAAFVERVGALGRNGPALWALLLSLKLYTYNGIRSVLSLMEEVGASLVQVAYQAKQLQTMFPPTAKMDQAVVAYYTDRVFTSLLETATMATKAEGGSVMVRNPQTGDYRISVAVGLPDEVIRRTTVRHGEGIAGVVAEGRRIVVVDDQVSDTRIRSRMQRAELTSSLVAPLLPDASQEPLGILSLRTSHPTVRFTSEHVDLLNNLLDLAGMALSSLQWVFNQARASSGP